MPSSDQQILSTYKKTWRFPLPPWFWNKSENVSFNRGLYLTFPSHDRQSFNSINFSPAGLVSTATHFGIAGSGGAAGTPLRVSRMVIRDA